MKKFKIILSWTFVFIWMGLIFYLSNQVGTDSSNLSGGVTDFLFNMIEKVFPNISLNILKFHTFIRKNAHFFSYLILGVLVSNSLRVSGVKSKKLILYALLISVLYAISDEVHQLFVPGRGGAVLDVLIDSAGSLTGIILYFLAFKYKKNKQK